MTTRKIAGIFLPFYFIAVASLSLSYIHIENTGTACLLVNGDVHHERNTHLMLHELLFAHCHNKSDYAAVPALEAARDIITKNCQDGPLPDTVQKYRTAVRFLTPVDSIIAAGVSLCVDSVVPIAGFCPLVSAHPPPVS